jgi:hypothetical protein
MNPSRIGTPVQKEIDEWHFRFNHKIIVFKVFIHRARDPQRSEDHPDPWIKFSAEVDSRSMEKAKIDPKEFALVTIKEDTIQKLRDRCQAHVEAMLRLNWKKVIIVGFQPEHEKELFMGRERRDPAVQLQFDYATGEQAGEFFRREDEDESKCYFLKEAANLLNGYSWEKKFVHVFDYDESLMATLALLKTKYEELNNRVAELVKPGKLELLGAALNRMLPPPPPDAHTP